QTLAELDYQTRLFDAMGLGRPAKIQMHAGEARGDPEGSLERFVERYQTLEDRLKAHLVLENDNVFCNLQRCLDVHRQTGIPIVFDVLHHEVDNRGEDVTSAMASALGTWRPEDGPPLVDYSSQRPDKLPGRHALSMDVAHFRRFLDNSRGFDFDLMLELKDRERGALAALGELAGDPRLVTGQRPVGQDAGGGSKERPSSAG
ncbi:MAG: hypothetical protein RBU30_22850, partial [Polyangia bacterium]|nr:hypothetical protein [Polyangia bacterium]